MGDSFGRKRCVVFQFYISDTVLVLGVEQLGAGKVTQVDHSFVPVAYVRVRFR